MQRCAELISERLLRHHFDEVAQFFTSLLLGGDCVGYLRLYQIPEAFSQAMNRDLDRSLAHSKPRRRFRLAHTCGVTREPRFEHLELLRFTLVIVLRRERSEGEIENGKAPLAVEPRIERLSFQGAKFETG
jgi:hypothetical protein